jgi:signal transduction histidine kinase
MDSVRKDSVKELLLQPQIDVSLRQLLKFTSVGGQTMDWANNYLGQEIPKRAAEEWNLLAQLPNTVKESASSVAKIQTLCQEAISDFAKVSKQDPEAFISLLNSWGDQLNDQNRALTEQLKDWVEKNNTASHERLGQVGNILEKTYIFKIWYKLLAGQYLTVQQQLRGQLPEGRLRSLVAEEPPRHLIQDAIGAARAHCIEKYGGAPNVVTAPDVDSLGMPSFLHVPHHLHFILVELLKNSFSATIKHHHTALRSTEHEGLPPVEVRVSRNKTEVGIRVSDQGGGMSRDDISKATSWYWSTMERKEPTGFAYSGDFGTPFEGFGLGLPLARLYAKINGGDLQIQSMPGYGTDAYVYLKTEQ